MHTEGEGQDATITLSHEKLFDAWPLLRDYVERNKKRLMDQTLLESRARKWEERGKPWFSGLASPWERKQFRTSEAISRRSSEYLKWSHQERRFVRCVVTLFCVIGLLFLYVAKQWQAGLSTEYAQLKLRSHIMSIHSEPRAEDMVDVKPGSFRMFDDRSKTTRDVKITRTFRIGKYEVTFDEYDRFALAKGKPLPDDMKRGRGRRPVIYVSFDDVEQYVARLSEKTGKRYRLPTEAEWEYAARSGGKDEIWAGTSGENQLATYAVFFNRQTEPVGSRKWNDLKSYDMSGNAPEWVKDCWHDNYEGAPTDGWAWLEAGGGDCRRRVVRGGSAFDEAVSLRASFRYRWSADSRELHIGFRLAQDIE